MKILCLTIIVSLIFQSAALAQDAFYTAINGTRSSWRCNVAADYSTIIEENERKGDRTLQLNPAKRIIRKRIVKFRKKMQAARSKKKKKKFRQKVSFDRKNLRGVTRCGKGSLPPSISLPGYRIRGLVGEQAVSISGRLSLEKNGRELMLYYQDSNETASLSVKILASLESMQDSDRLHVYRLHYGRYEFSNSFYSFSIDFGEGIIEIDYRSLPEYTVRMHGYAKDSRYFELQQYFLQTADNAEIPTGPIFYDGDGDDDLDYTDMTMFENCFTGSNNTVSSTECLRWDTNADSAIDMVDFQRVYHLGFFRIKRTSVPGGGYVEYPELWSTTLLEE